MLINSKALEFRREGQHPDQLLHSFQEAQRFVRFIQVLNHGHFEQWKLGEVGTRIHRTSPE